METEFAAAKVNLTLHVTGRRADGYHLLDSLVAFVDVGDRVSVRLADRLSLTVSGPYAAELDPGPGNLVLRAARAFGGDAGAEIILDKHLPVASGIGGGSADAAATLRLLSRVWGRALPNAAQVLRLGADVPVCLAGRAARMTGVGDGMAPVALPGGWIVLINPGVALATPDVFAALENCDNAPMPRAIGPFRDTADLAAFLGIMRNDLGPAARSLAPVIADVEQALAAQPGCLIARMSGSGATCFGLFADRAAAQTATGKLRQTSPGWWVQAGAMLA